MNKNWRYSVLGAGALMLLVFGSTMYLLTKRQDAMLRQQEYDQASAVFDVIIIARTWNSRFGGVYVEKKPGLVSSPYLAHPDIRTAAGKAYTLKTPATMTREMSEISHARDGVSFRITSRKPFNPDNAPDPWEDESLTAFERGEKERTTVATRGGKRVFRLMKPLHIDATCLPCHAVQGYKLGEVRGGISVDLPFDEHWELLRKNALYMAGLALLLTALFAGTLYAVIWTLLEKLSRQNALLSDLNHTKDRFLGMAAHDLRNPLAVIYGIAKVLKEDSAGKPHAGLADIVVASAQRMLGLITDLLDVSKINAGRLDLKIADVCVPAFVAEAVHAQTFLAEPKGIAVAADIAPGVGNAAFDPDRMRQVLDNLISNALKFSNPGTRVTVGARRDGPELRLWVQDEGIGISDEDLPKLFGEFSKTRSAPTAGEPSHGLGLAITKRLVELHGGRIEVASLPGKGTCFTVILPQ
ncbi:MAG: DUF3365 domain-containing protein [Elusimicrobia bacterium]|nr:DUF3365 domain-containing protein [Elusimicrobiota bacterium]